MRERFAALCDRLEAEAVALGVCPKVAQYNNSHRGTHYCGKPLAEGSRFCLRHKYGV